MSQDQELELTYLEERLVEQYVRVLDFTSRCAQAVDGGNLHYLQDKARQLAGATETLRHVAEEAWAAYAQDRRAVRPAVVRAAVAMYGRHYRAGRLLHPLDRAEGGGT